MSILKWLLGERASRAVNAGWNWLWGKAANDGGELSVAVAEESLTEMARAVQQLAEAVGMQKGAYDRALKIYQDKGKEHKQYMERAALAQSQGNNELAKMAMTKALEIEAMLPSAETAVNQAKALLDQSMSRLDDQRRRLEANKAQLSNMRDMAQINAALQQVANTSSEFNLSGAQSDFDKARQAVLNQGAKTNAVLALSEDPNARLAKQLDQLGMDEEINKRLAALNQAQSNVLEGEVTNG